MIVVDDLGDNEMREEKKKNSGLRQMYPLPKKRSVSKLNHIL